MPSRTGTACPPPRARGNGDRRKGRALATDIHRSPALTAGRALLLLWSIEALFVVVLASRFLGALDRMTGRTPATDGVPPGVWFLVHPPLERRGEATIVRSSDPISRWLQQSSDPAYCCWRRWSTLQAYRGYDTEPACQQALDALRRRGRAPLALQMLSTSADVALANARCVHATSLWDPTTVADEVDDE